MIRITPDELQKATNLYENTKKYSYGSLRNKTARMQYDKYTAELSEKYNCEKGEIHGYVLAERKVMREKDER